MVYCTIWKAMRCGVINCAAIFTSASVSAGCYCGVNKEEGKSKRRERERETKMEEEQVAIEREAGTEGLRSCCQKRFVGAKTFVKRDFCFHPSLLLLFFFIIIWGLPFLVHSIEHKSLERKWKKLKTSVDARIYFYFLYPALFNIFTH